MCCFGLIILRQTKASKHHWSGSLMGTTSGCSPGDPHTTRRHLTVTGAPLLKAMCFFLWFHRGAADPADGPSVRAPTLCCLASPRPCPLSWTERRSSSPLPELAPDGLQVNFPKRAQSGRSPVDASPPPPRADVWKATDALCPAQPDSRPQPQPCTVPARPGSAVFLPRALPPVGGPVCPVQHGRLRLQEAALLSNCATSGFPLRSPTAVCLPFVLESLSAHWSDPSPP